MIISSVSLMMSRVVEGGGGWGLGFLMFISLPNQPIIAYCV